MECCPALFPSSLVGAEVELVNGVVDRIHHEGQKSVTRATGSFGGASVGDAHGSPADSDPQVDDQSDPVRSHDLEELCFSGIKRCVKRLPDALKLRYKQRISSELDLQKCMEVTKG